MSSKDLPTWPDDALDDAVLVSLARELVINFRSPEDIQRAYDITPTQWEALKNNRRFVALVRQHTAEWESALNTHERVKYKTAAMLEDWLPEAHARLHDTSETLNSKVELAKLVSRLAGMGLTHAGIEGASGEKVSITINLGDQKVSFEKEVTPKTIDQGVV